MLNNFKEFICHDVPCVVDVEDNTILTFFAQAHGENSHTINANIKVYQQGNDYFVNITTQSRPFYVTDACAETWNILAPPETIWGEFVLTPQELNTQKKLHYLAAKLIMSGVVDASSCPNGGLIGNAPNQCGLEKAFPEMVRWQNQFDFSLWMVSRNYRLPPKILKTLIEVKSQFWPSDARAYIDEIGLGQVNQLGVDVLLRYNTAVYKIACEPVLGDCNTPYAYQPPAIQRMICGAFLQSLSATCATCPQGIDRDKAKQSIPLVGVVLQSNCAQVKHLLDLYKETTTYENYWKFTLVSYHSGLGCLQNAVAKISDTGKPMTWELVANEIRCSGAKEYVEKFWSNLQAFDSNRQTMGQLALIPNIPIYAPTATPKPSPTPIVSRARIMVFVVNDRNGNNLAEADEWLNNVGVKVTLPDGTVLTGKTINGSVSFDMSGYAPRTPVTVTLLDPSWRQDLLLATDGVMTVLFKVGNGDLPVVMP